MNVLLNPRTSITMWFCLILVHEQNSRENKHIMEQRFFEFQMIPSQDMISFIVVVETMAAQFNDMGEPTIENVVISKILCNLPMGY